MRHVPPWAPGQALFSRLEGSSDLGLSSRLLRERTLRKRTLFKRTRKRKHSLGALGSVATCFCQSADKLGAQPHLFVSMLPWQHSICNLAWKVLETYPMVCRSNADHGSQAFHVARSYDPFPAHAWPSKACRTSKLVDPCPATVCVYR